MTESTGAQPETTTMRRLKRSRTLQVTSLMATVSFSMAACGAPRISAPASPSGPAEPTLAYTSLDECKAANDITDTECDAAQSAARTQAAESSPRYATREECEGQWGPSQCEPTNRGGGSFFTPLLAGFVVGQLLNGGGYRGGGALYRDRDNRYSNGYGGGYVQRDYRTGRTIANGRDYGGDVARQAPARTQSRTTVVSRGGFGGGGRGYGG